MKAILFVILNISVCFPRGSVGVEILIPGEVWGSNEKNFPGSLSLAMTPPLKHTFNFYPGSTPKIFSIVYPEVSLCQVSCFYHQLSNSSHILHQSPRLIESKQKHENGKQDADVNQQSGHARGITSERGSSGVV